MEKQQASPWASPPPRPGTLLCVLPSALWEQTLRWRTRRGVEMGPCERKGPGCTGNQEAAAAQAPGDLTNPAGSSLGHWMLLPRKGVTLDPAL